MARSSLTGRTWHRALPLALLVLLVLPVNPVHAGTPGGPSPPAVRAVLVAERPGRPPLTHLLVDLTISNPGGAPLWALIPANLPLPAEGTGGVNRLEQQTVTGVAGRVVLARLLGRAGGYVLRLGAGARVTLRGVEIGWWRGPLATAAEVSFVVRFAGGVSLDGQPLAGWFEGDPTIAGAAEVDVRTAPHTHRRSAPGGREVPLVAREVVSVPVQLAAP